MANIPKEIPIAVTTMQPTIQLRKGKVRWYYVAISSNGQVTMTSEKFFSKSNARRGAKKTAQLMYAIYEERE